MVLGGLLSLLQRESATCISSWGQTTVFPNYPPTESPSLTTLFSGHLLCLWGCVSRQTLCRGHRCGCCSVAGQGGADGCLPVSDRSILPGQGHSTGWDQLLAHCAKDGFAG